eukprot:scaffold38028_cov79-Phaeocystis_antarctica.AAC.2
MQAGNSLLSYRNYSLPWICASPAPGALPRSGCRSGSRSRAPPVVRVRVRVRDADQDTVVEHRLGCTTRHAVRGTHDARGRCAYGVRTVRGAQGEAALRLRYVQYVQYGGPTCQHRAPPTSCLAPRTRRTRGCPAVCGRPPSAAAARPGRAPSSPPPGALGGGAALSAAPGRSRPAKRLAAVVSNCQQLPLTYTRHPHRARVFSI